MRALAGAAVLAVMVAGVPGAFGQTPDNSGVKLDTSEGAGSPGYEETLNQREREELERARREGGSLLPVLTGPAASEEGDPVSPLDATVPPAPQGRQVLTEGQVEPQPVQRVRPQQDAIAPEPVVRGGAIAEEVGDLDAFVAVLVKAMDREPDIRRVVYGRVERGAPALAEPVGEFLERGLPTVGAGDAFYGRVLHAVNSDYPGPVLIELLQPPLQGAVARGAFQLVRDRLVIRISALDVAGETVPVDAVAVGLDCGCFGVSGEVSYHWWERLILPAAFGFTQQYLVARAQTDKRVVEVEGGAVVTEESEASARQARDAGFAAAIGRAGEVLLAQAPTAQTVEIPGNSEVAVMFAERLKRRAAASATPVADAVPVRVERVRAPVSDPGEDR